MIRLFKLAFLGLAGALVASWLQELHPAFDSPTHFRPYFCAALLVICLALVYARAWTWVASGVLVIGTSLVLTQPYLGLADQSGVMDRQQTGTDTLRVVQMNMRYNNNQPERAGQVIADAQPDIVILQEVTTGNDIVLRSLAGELPNQVSCYTPYVASVAILSRFPFSSAGNNNCFKYLGFARAGIVVNGRELNIASFHSRWPWPFSQPRQVKELRREFEGLEHPLILAGDFNSAPWSAIVQKVARYSRSRLPEKMLLTWTTKFSFVKKTIGPLLPIDHIMVSPDLMIDARSTLPDGGSDHLPVLSLVKLPEVLGTE